MLVLSRKLGESVSIGAPDDFSRVVQITVLEIGNSQIKLGFEGPRDVPIHRWEVWLRITGGGQNGAQDSLASQMAAGNWEDEGGLSAPSDGYPSLAPSD